MKRRIEEADVVIIGGGITAAMVAEKLTDERDVSVHRGGGGHRVGAPGAGASSAASATWTTARTRGPTTTSKTRWPWVSCPAPWWWAGRRLHWGGTTPRFTPEDFRHRSMFGVHVDWPLDYDTLDPYYQEAEERIGISGEQGPEPLDPRGAPYPMPAVPLTWTLERLQGWVTSAGIPTWINPVAKNTRPWKGRNVCLRCDTCNICPTGAKYTPDFTFQQLVAAGRIRMHPRTLVRRLELEEGTDRIHAAVARSYDDPDTEVVYRAKTFVLAAGYTWSPHLLLLSAQGRYPDGLANSSGLVGRYMAGHRSVSAFVELPMRLLPGMYYGHSLISKYFQRPTVAGGPGLPRGFMRHDFRVWESTTARGPRLRDDDGCASSWATTSWPTGGHAPPPGPRGSGPTTTSSPTVNSRVELDTSRRNRFGDPLPTLHFQDAPVSRDLRQATEDRIRGVFDRLARVGNGRILRTSVDDVQDHPGGGCRMSDDPGEGVVNSSGRTHDHENLFVVGAPTMVSGGCSNGTLTFSALSLRSAEEMGRDFPARQG